MIDLNSSDTKRNEGAIARAQRRTRELGEGGLALAKREAEQFIQSLAHEPPVQSAFSSNIPQSWMSAFAL
jgi:hypothetical protein